MERLARVSGAGVAAWLLPDRLGSIRNIVDGTGAGLDTIFFDAFGNITSESSIINGGAYKFVGYRSDAETGFYRSDATDGRVVLPSIGRFNSVDPTPYFTADTNPWRYVRNNTTNFIDSSGLQREVDPRAAACLPWYGALLGASLGAGYTIYGANLKDLGDPEKNNLGTQVAIGIGTTNAGIKKANVKTSFTLFGVKCVLTEDLFIQVRAVRVFPPGKLSSDDNGSVIYRIRFTYTNPRLDCNIRVACNKPKNNDGNARRVVDIWGGPLRRGVRIRPALESFGLTKFKYQYDGSADSTAERIRWALEYIKGAGLLIDNK